MKKEMSILIALLLGLSFKTYAGTGGAADEFFLSLVVIGFLLLILGLISAIDFLKKNGKTIVRQAISFLKKMVNLLRNHDHNVKSEHFSQHDFRLHC